MRLKLQLRAVGNGNLGRAGQQGHVNSHRFRILAFPFQIVLPRVYSAGCVDTQFRLALEEKHDRLTLRDRYWKPSAILVLKDIAASHLVLACILDFLQH